MVNIDSIIRIIGIVFLFRWILLYDKAFKCDICLFSCHKQYHRLNVLNKKTLLFTFLEANSKGKVQRRFLSWVLTHEHQKMFSRIIVKPPIILDLALFIFIYLFIWHKLYELWASSKPMIILPQLAEVLDSIDTSPHMHANSSLMTQFNLSL